MRRFSYLEITILLLIAFPLTSIGQPKDLRGYGNTEWGMSPDKVLEIGSETKKVKDPTNYMEAYAPISKSFDSSIYTVKVDFQFTADSDSLAQVLLIPDNESSVAFQHMTEELVRRYGEPTFRREHEGDIDIYWRFPTTTVEISFGSGGTGSTLRVSYYPTIGEETPNY